MALAPVSTPPTRTKVAIAADLARALDPVLLAEEAGIVPDPWQAHVLRSTSARVLLNCSRQSGGLGHMTLDAGGKDTFLRPVSSTV